MKLFGRKTLARALFAAVIIFSVFAYSVDVRRVTFNRFPGPGDYLWRSLQTHTLNFTRNWHWEGAFKYGLVPGFHSASIERDGKALYVSYPPMFVIIPHVLATVGGFFPDLAFLMRLSLAAHLLSALLLFVLLQRFLKRSEVGANAASYFSLLASCLFLLVPACLLFFQNTWWADTAVIPLFLAMILVDSLSVHYGAQRWFRLATAGLVFMGAATDWLFHCLVACVLLRRITDPVARRWWPELVFPVVAQLIWHAGMIFYTGRFQSFSEKIELRTGLSAQAESFSLGIANWLRTVESFYGTLGLYGYFALLVAFPLVTIWFLWRRKGKDAPLAELCFLLLAPVVLHSLVLREHYYAHLYESLKLAPALLTFALILPVGFLWRRCRNSAGRATVLLLVTALAVVYWSTFPARYRELLSAPLSLDLKVQEIGEKIAPNVAFSDVLISPDFYTRVVFPGQGVEALEGAREVSHKEVYLTQDPSVFTELYRWNHWDYHLKNKPHRFRGIFLGKPKGEWTKFVTPEPALELSHGYFLYNLDMKAAIPSSN